MKTKYGDIKSIYDFFEDTKQRKDIGGNPPFNHEEMVWKCKICGDKITTLSVASAFTEGDDFPYDILKRHIELHKIVKAIT